MKSALFIDIGAHVGEAFKHFSGIYSTADYDYNLYEPNPDCYGVLCQELGSNPDVTIVNKAVFIHEGFAPFYGNSETATAQVHAEDGFSVGCSLIKDHNSLHYAASPLRTVQCVDICRVLEDARRVYKTIVVKMDVEGAEYAILQRVKDNGMMTGIVHKWYIEFHTQYSDSADMKNLHAQVYAMLSNDGVNFVDWH